MREAQVVTSEPEVSITQLEDDDRFLVLASDGVWDRMSNDEVVSFVLARLQAHGDPLMAARELADHAMLALRSSDNVSVIVVVPRKLRQTTTNARFPGI